MAKKHEILVTNFWKLNDENKFSSNIISFYLFLVENYRINKYEKFTFSDVVIGKKLSMNRATVKKVKDNLKHFRLIDYVNSNGKPSEYILNFHVSIDNKIQIVESNSHIPKIEEILEYCCSLDEYEDALKQSIIDKYNTWVKLGWKTQQNRIITDWKALLKGLLPFFKNQPANLTLQKIKRPEG